MADNYIMIQIDDLGRSPLQQSRHATGRYGKKLRPGVSYQLWHRAEGEASERLLTVQLSELFSHVRTGRGAGQSSYVYAEMEIVA